MQILAAPLAGAFLTLVLLQSPTVHSAEPAVPAQAMHPPALSPDSCSDSLSFIDCPFASRSLGLILTRRPLRHLELQGCRLSDEACRLIAECGELRELQLAGSCLSDRAVAELAGLNGLRRLDLRGTPISDAALEDLAALVGLELLDLRGTRVSPAAVLRLQARRQKLQILFDRTCHCLLANAGLLRAAPAGSAGQRTE